MRLCVWQSRRVGGWIIIMDYWKGHEMRTNYFNVVARHLIDPTQWYQGRICVLGKILVLRRREIE